MFNWLFTKKEKRKREKTYVCKHCKLTCETCATLATQILEIHVQDVKKQILWKKSSYFLYLRIYFLIL